MQDSEYNHNYSHIPFSHIWSPTVLPVPYKQYNKNRIKIFIKNRSSHLRKSNDFSTSMKQHHLNYDLPFLIL